MLQFECDGHTHVLIVTEDVMTLILNIKRHKKIQEGRLENDS